MRVPTSVVATRVIETVDTDPNGEMKTMTDTTSAAITKLISHTHTPYLRANRGLTLCAVRLLTDILLKEPAALADYRGFVNFLCANMDAAITGNFTISSIGRDTITEGVSQYSSLQCGIDRVDDEFITCCVQSLNSLLRAQRYKQEITGIIEDNHRILPTFTNLQSYKQSSFKDGSNGTKPLGGGTIMKQTTQLREMVCSKLLGLGESLLLLGTATMLRPVLRLMVRCSLLILVF
jgi:hypothetical protein